MIYIYQNLLEDNHSMKDILKIVEQKIKDEGIESIHDLPDGDLAIFRPLELACAINRLRNVKVKVD